MISRPLKRYSQIVDVVSMLNNGHVGLLVDKIKMQHPLSMSLEAAEMVANQVQDLDMFMVIYNAYRHRFVAGGVITAAIHGCNLKVVKVLMGQRQPIIPIRALEAITVAFRCADMDMLQFIIGNVDLTELDNPLSTDYPIGQSDIKPCSLAAYRYLGDTLSATRFATVFGDDPLHVVGLQSIELFDEAIGGKVISEKTSEALISQVAHTFMHKCHHRDAAKPVRYGFIKFFEHVLLACTKDQEDIDRIKEIRTKVAGLTSTMTPEKETTLMMLGYVMDYKISGWLYRTRPYDFAYMVEWRDMELTQHMLNAFGFDAICQRGTLAQVQEANRLFGMFDRASTDAMDNKDIEVLKYLQANRTEGCRTNRLENESNLEVVKFLMESMPPHSLVVSINTLISRGQMDILRYLKDKPYLDVDNDTDGTLCDIGFYDYVVANCSVDSKSEAIVSACTYGHLKLIKHIFTKNPELLPTPKHLRECIVFDQYHVLEYFFANYKVQVPAHVMKYAIGQDSHHCLKVLNLHHPTDMLKKYIK
eukprot:gene13431-15829_t